MMTLLLKNKNDDFTIKEQSSYDNRSPFTSEIDAYSDSEISLNLLKEITKVQEEVITRMQNRSHNLPKSQVYGKDIRDIKQRQQNIRMMLQQVQKEVLELSLSCKWDKNSKSENNSEQQTTKEGLKFEKCKELLYQLIFHIKNESNIDQFIEIIDQESNKEDNNELIIQLQSLLNQEIEQIKQQELKIIQRVQQLTQCQQKLYEIIENRKNIFFKIKNKHQISAKEQILLDSYLKQTKDSDNKNDMYQFCLQFLCQKKYNKNRHTLLEYNIVNIKSNYDTNIYNKTDNDTNILQYTDQDVIQYCCNILESQYSTSDFFTYCKDGNLQAVYCIIMREDPNILQKIDENDKDKKTGLLYASKNGRYDIIRIMYEQFQIDIEQQDRCGRTALLLVCRYTKNKNIANMLLKYGANIEQQTAVGNTALFYACANDSNKEIVEVLLKNGANTEHETKEGWTVLLLSCRYNKNKDNVESLLKYNANIEFQSKQGQTGFILSCCANNIDIVNLLLKYNYTNVDHKNDIDGKDGYYYLREENKKKVRDYIDMNNLKVKKPELRYENY